MANFGRNIPTEISGPPSEVISNILVRKNRSRLFHLNSTKISGIFGIMESTLSLPGCEIAKRLRLFMRNIRAIMAKIKLPKKLHSVVTFLPSQGFGKPEEAV